MKPPLVSGAWLAVFVFSGCVCVDTLSGNFPCSSDEDCAGGFYCIAERCSNGTTDAGGCTTGTGGLADCSNLACAGQPCQLTSLSRGICCGTACVDPGGNDNCGGCGNTCPNSFCAFASSSTVVSGYCSCAATACPGTQICYLGGCVCRSDADCLRGQQCSMLPAIGGVCWYPP